MAANLLLDIVAMDVDWSWNLQAPSSTSPWLPLLHGAMTELPDVELKSSGLDFVVVMEASQQPKFY